MDNDTVSVAPCPVGAGALSCPAAAAARVYEFDVLIWPWLLGQDNKGVRRWVAVQASDEAKARKRLVWGVLNRYGLRASLFVVGVRA